MYGSTMVMHILIKLLYDNYMDNMHMKHPPLLKLIKVLMLLYGKKVFIS